MYVNLAFKINGIDLLIVTQLHLPQTCKTVEKETSDVKTDTAIQQSESSLYLSSEDDNSANSASQHALSLVLKTFEGTSSSPAVRKDTLDVRSDRLKDTEVGTSVSSHNKAIPKLGEHVKWLKMRVSAQIITYETSNNFSLNISFEADIFQASYICSNHICLGLGD